MKCKNCSACHKGYFKSKPDDYVCIGVCEPFVIRNIDNECTEYKDLKESESGIFSAKLLGLRNKILGLKSKKLGLIQLKQKSMVELR